MLSARAAWANRQSCGLQGNPGLPSDLRALQNQLHTSAQTPLAQTWQALTLPRVGPAHVGFSPGMAGPRSSGGIVQAADIFGGPDMSMGERQRSLPGSARLQTEQEEFEQQLGFQPRLPQGPPPILQGYPVGQPAEQQAGARTPSRDVRQSLQLDLMPEHFHHQSLPTGPFAGALQGLVQTGPADRMFGFPPRRSDPVGPGPVTGQDVHDGASSTGSRGSPQMPQLRSMAASPGRAVRGSPGIPRAQRGRSHSLSALPRGPSLVHTNPITLPCIFETTFTCTFISAYTKDKFAHAWDHIRCTHTRTYMRPMCWAHAHAALVSACFTDVAPCLSGLTPLG